MNKPNLVLYHNNCTDGMCSSFLLYLFFKEINEEADFIAVNYNEPIPVDVTGKNVYIVDFSYHPDVIAEAGKTAKFITMLDHHLTAAEQWDGYKRLQYQNEEGCFFDINIVEEKSGAGLVYDYLLYLNLPYKSVFNNTTLQRVVTRVEDRDLWKFQYPDTKIIHEALSIIPKSNEDWEKLIINEPEDFYHKLDEAKNYLYVKEVLANEYASKFEMINFNGYNIPITNCPSNFASDVGHILALDHPFSLTYCLNSKIVFCSLRSNKETGVEVKNIAEKFGGGGHLNSSGFKIKPEQLLELLKGNL